MLSNLDRTPAVKHILILNVIVFIVMNFTSIGQHYNIFSLHYFDTTDFGVWQLITHMFLHANLGESFGLMHILFNMMMLFQFGPILEQKWGTKKFVLFYFTAGIGGALFFSLNIAGTVYYAFHTFFPVSEGLLNPAYLSTAVGASSAITAIVVSFAYLHPNTKLMLLFIPVPIKAKYLVGAFLVWDLVAGILGTLSTINVLDIYRDNIAHYAHLGGAVFGMILLLYWQKNRNNFY